MIRIAVDAMGGDRGPETIVDGALDAARESGVSLSLVGREDRLRELLADRPDASALDVVVVPADEAVGMGERPTAALRQRPRASIRVAAAEVAAGRAAALFSAGNTGATVMAAHAAFGMLEGAERPALAVIVPTRRSPAVLLDVGATVACRPRHLVQFAAMGAVYARMALGVERPRVGLLSIGEEETKGNDLTRQAHRLLEGERAELHRQPRGARRLRGRRRRDCVRRVHGEHRAQGERGPRGDDRRPAARSGRRAWATSWRRGSAGNWPTCSGGGWTIRNSGACRCSASRGSP